MLGLMLLQFTATAAELRVGFDGAFVAGRWNPIEFSMRDQSAVTLTITIDQGDLRTGAVPVRYIYELAGGPGLSVIEDELFIPAWQSFSWSAASPARVIASGSFHPRDVDDRPLALIASTEPARHAGLVPAGTRLVAYGTSSLPERLAAWDGVALLLFDGSTAPPPLEVVISAATAGSNVVLLEPLPDSYGELRRLAAGPVTRLGAGQIVRGDAAEVADLLEPLTDSVSLEGFLSELNELELQQPVRPVFLFPLLIMYGVAALVLLRSSGLPGVIAVSALGVLAVVIAWPSLNPEATLSRSQLQLSVSAGGLSRTYQSVRLLHREGGDLVLAGHLRPTTPLPYAVREERTALTAERWRPVQLAARPELTTAGTSAGATDDLALLSVFPAGSTARATDGRIEVFLPEPVQ